MKNNPLIIEFTLNTPVAKVWKALTDIDQMKHWYFDIIKFEPKVEYEISFTGGKDDRSYLHLLK